MWSQQEVRGDERIVINNWEKKQNRQEMGKQAKCNKKQKAKQMNREEIPVLAACCASVADVLAAVKWYKGGMKWVGGSRTCCQSLPVVLFFSNGRLSPQSCIFQQCFCASFFHWLLPWWLVVFFLLLFLCFLIRFVVCKDTLSNLWTWTSNQIAVSIAGISEESGSGLRLSFFNHDWVAIQVWAALSRKQRVYRECNCWLLPISTRFVQRDATASPAVMEQAEPFTQVSEWFGTSQQAKHQLCYTTRFLLLNPT